jgi:hypothetical protein
MNAKLKKTSRPKGDLTAYWNHKENDLMFYHSKHPPDGHLIYNYFCTHPMFECKSFTDELEKRGYDVTTLKFSIQYKQPLDKEENKNE